MRRTSRPRLWRNASLRQIQPGVQTTYEPVPDELDGFETELVADVESHPEASATY
jgi:hypothetical protein